ncbi:2-oxo acid dehydrogenase subunit E2 [Glaciihabitans sp. GrIS 2.15]|nr:pyruvate dehydrogenase E2 component (dihydrolipoamide acetyltransferase) [Glaciihabitans sp. GrIS 2.15]
MSESVNLPALGESVTEGTVTRWLKNVGDRVEVDEPLLEVSTDKVDTEIPSPIAGVIEAILVAEDETVEVGTPLVTIGDGSGSTDATPEVPAADATEAVTPTLPEDAQPAAEVAPAPAVAAPAVAAPAVPAPAIPATVEPVAAPVALPEQIPDPPQEPPVAAAEPVAQAPSPYAPAPEQHAPAAPVAAAPVAVAPVEVAPVAVAPVAVAPVALPPAATTAPEAPATPVPAAPAPAAPAPATPAPATPAPAAPALDSKPGYFTPLVRKLANEKGIDLSTITGSGVGGRIRKEDLLAVQSEIATAVGSADVAPVAPAAALETSPLRGTSVPMSRLRKVIAERAVISMQSSAQLTSVVEVDVTIVANFRDAVKAEFLAKTGQKLSFLPFFALAAAEALRAFPIINATIDGDSIVYPSQENMAIAVDTERGLLTPVIRDAGSLDLAGLAAQIADLAARTRDNKLKPDELAGGTFTLTNTGSRGALFDTPIVFLPQSAILGTGIVAKKPVVVSSGGLDAIAIRSMVYLALSYDHRIVDGADAARFLVAVKARLEGGDFAANLGY